ncbi:hypothetical protein FD09_GL002057 [Schleiferilactobacillus perolens DSM 12744]|uniref:Uncharacterized protein n=1 Tax=Schleiferilactobacillus perolens DSM 12744 TaxID=1423792 RepID=A0A0R1MGM5_9LACO|nr:hypothetical protein FD09_GL002057 [Schleiferilactobacillus perolens DSM 12744]
MSRKQALVSPSPVAANDSGQAGSAWSGFGATAPKGFKKTFQRFLLIRLFWFVL